MLRQSMHLLAAALVGCSVGASMSLLGGITEAVLTLSGAALAASIFYRFIVAGPKVTVIGYFATAATFGFVVGSGVPCGLAALDVLAVGDRTWDDEWEDIAAGVIIVGSSSAVCAMAIAVSLLAFISPGSFIARTDFNSNSQNRTGV